MVVKIRRVQMTSHEPTYFIGVSFAEPDSVDPNIGDRIMLLKGAGEGDPAPGAASPPTPPGAPDA